MGQYTIVITGTGPHHNSPHHHAIDADRVARDAIQALKAGGHTIVHAAITAGFTDPLAAGVRAVASAERAAAGDYVILKLDDGGEAVLTGMQLAMVASPPTTKTA
jgi:hypothetical protein